MILVVCNFTPVPRQLSGRRARGGHWREILNSDSKNYGGADFGNLGGMQAEPTPSWPAVFPEPDGTAAGRGFPQERVGRTTTRTSSW